MSAVSEAFGPATLYRGDCLDVMREMAERGETVHAVVTDPPYHLTAGKKGGTGPASVNLNSPAGRARITAGFMGKTWDGGDIAFQPATWRLCYDLLPPGGHLVAFGGTRTFHRMAVAIEDAGFELRDTLMYLYGVGFPKSHNQPGGWGTALKPAFEPIILARRPLSGTVAANVLAHGVGAINVDGCRVPPTGEAMRAPQSDPANRRGVVGAAMQATGDAARNHAAQAASIQRTMDLGRWPANVLHDGSDEVEAAFAAFGERKTTYVAPHHANNRDGGFLGQLKHPGNQGFNDTGSASRFFYSAKASAADRAGSKHPTVKPVALMRWLVRLITPPGGIVLDPFAGSGTTAAAAFAERMSAVLIESDAEHAEDIRRRLRALVPSGFSLQAAE